jgi:hypothetical protein
MCGLGYRPETGAVPGYEELGSKDWLSQSFLQLVLLPIIIVGQNIISSSQDARAEADHETLTALHDINVQQLELLEQQKNILDLLQPKESYLDSVASTASSTLPFRACEIGQFSFASSARRVNVAESIPGTSPRTVRTDEAIFQPASRWSKVTSARTSRFTAGVPFLARREDSAIEKQLAWAAASSSSGLVLPLCSLVREAQLIGRRDTTPLERYVIIPDPLIKSPFQVTVA